MLFDRNDRAPGARRILPGIALWAGLLAGMLPLGPNLPAPAVPSYKDVQERLVVLWKEKIPVSLLRTVPDPGKRGVLTAVQDGKQVYYYHFSAVIGRPVRMPDGSLGSQGERVLEVWVRFRSWEKDAYDISFARMDRLPGTEKRWIK